MHSSSLSQCRVTTPAEWDHVQGARLKILLQDPKIYHVKDADEDDQRVEYNETVAYEHREGMNETAEPEKHGERGNTFVSICYSLAPAKPNWQKLN